MTDLLTRGYGRSAISRIRDRYFAHRTGKAYQRVNERFAAALLDEMKGSAEPLVFVQDYHFALLPRLIKAARPDARVAIFWHIPWPNPEAFGICPWQAPTAGRAFSALI